MKSGEKDLTKKDIDFLNQLTASLEQAEIKLEQSYKQKKPHQFNAIKKFVLNVNRKISEVIE